MKIDNDMVIFSTGRREYAHAGIIGLCPNLGVTGGYDNDFYSPEDHKGLNPDEQIELAEFMIGKWEEFKHRALNS